MAINRWPRLAGKNDPDRCRESLLVAGGIDLVSVKSAMGHANMSTTERYLHARPATELAERFTRALLGTIGDHAQPGSAVSHSG